jgi:hypothetical protein
MVSRTPCFDTGTKYRYLHLGPRSRCMSRTEQTVTRGTFEQLDELQAWLNGHGVDTASWGRGKAKRVDNLMKEIEAKVWQRHNEFFHVRVACMLPPASVATGEYAAAAWWENFPLFGRRQGMRPRFPWRCAPKFQTVCDFAAGGCAPTRQDEALPCVPPADNGGWSRTRTQPATLREALCRRGGGQGG